ncbi:hypothetical protein GCM10009864_45620 [Streptomyces lunalinharesii]|uniref:Uncharacterized protein n=1 Tax=Streptomyces lunalinharesii TaxID=333384 RepID=A0ABN3S8E5_9ACTN
MAMVSAVPVPSVANESGTITKSEDAGVRQDRVSRVPPTTPIDRVSLGLSAGVVLRTSGAAVAVTTGVVGISVIRVPSVLEGRKGRHCRRECRKAVAPEALRGRFGDRNTTSVRHSRQEFVNAAWQRNP